MNRWRMRGVAALAVITLAVAGCDQMNDAGDDLISPGTDQTIPSPTTDAGTDMSPGMEMSPGTDESPGTELSPDASPSPDS